MKKIVVVFFIIYSFTVIAQKKSSYLQADYFYGNTIAGSAEAFAFLQGHPQGVFFSYNKRVFGNKDWEELYNYPDFGFSAGYIDFKSIILGKLYAGYGHYNFYFFNRKNTNKLALRVGFGLAYNTNPYNKETNNKNVAISTHINSSTYFKLYYQRENIFKRFGITAGLTFIHASNSNIKSPNAGVNLWAATIGTTYELDKDYKEKKVFIASKLSLKYTEPIKVNLAIRGGVNESGIIGSGARPFVVLSAYADKRINRKSAIQLGTDFFVSPMLKDFYEINKSILHTNYKETTNFYRLGVFIGHELFINKLSLETQVGYYAIQPFEYQTKIYETVGLKRYFKNNKWFASVRVKAHLVDAESVEFGVGVRL